LIALLGIALPGITGTRLEPYKILSAIGAGGIYRI